MHTRRHHLLSRREFWSDFIKYRYCEKLKFFKNYPNFFWNVYMYETENYCESEMKQHIQGLKNHLKKNTAHKQKLSHILPLHHITYITAIQCVIFLPFCLSIYWACNVLLPSKAKHCTSTLTERMKDRRWVRVN